MKVVLVRLGFLDKNWFEKNKGKVFDVIRKQENGYEVNLSPCGHPEKTSFLRSEEVVEVASPVFDSVWTDAVTIETAAHCACASRHCYGPGTLELVKNLLERVAKNGTDRVHRLAIAATIHLNEIEKLEKQADYELRQFQNFVRDIRKAAREEK